MANNPMRDKMRTMWRGLGGLQFILENSEFLYVAKAFTLEVFGNLGQINSDFSRFGLISRDVCRLMAAIEGLLRGNDYHGWGLPLKDELLEWIRVDSENAPQVFSHYKTAYDKTNRAGRIYLLKLDIDDRKHLLPELRWWNLVSTQANIARSELGWEPSE